MTRVFEIITRYFFIWTILAGILAVLWPPLFTWFSGALIPLGLGFIMLGMGITLAPADFARVLKTPAGVLAGVLLQYTVMPALGWFMAWAWGLPGPYAVGLILTASCPGGTASNVITFLARANLGLSVTMTAISTLLAVFLTPLLTGTLAGNRMEVNVLGLFLTTFKVVILPVAIGVFLNRYAPRFAAKVQPAAPAVATILIILIVGSVLGKSWNNLWQGPDQAAVYRLLAAVLFTHLGGFVFGYLLGKILLREENSARTTSIEVGMQNSGLSVELARSNFAANPLVMVPGAISAICHCILGSLAAAYWRNKTKVDS